MIEKVSTSVCCFCGGSGMDPSYYGSITKCPACDGAGEVSFRYTPDPDGKTIHVERIEPQSELEL